MQNAQLWVRVCVCACVWCHRGGAWLRRTALACGTGGVRSTESPVTVATQRAVSDAGPAAPRPPDPHLALPTPPPPPSSCCPSLARPLHTLLAAQPRGRHSRGRGAAVVGLALWGPAPGGGDVVALVRSKLPEPPSSQAPLPMHAGGQLCRVRCCIAPCAMRCALPFLVRAWYHMWRISHRRTSYGRPDPHADWRLLQPTHAGGEDVLAAAVVLRNHSPLIEPVGLATHTRLDVWFIDARVWVAPRRATGAGEGGASPAAPQPREFRSHDPGACMCIYKDRHCCTCNARFGKSGDSQRPEHVNSRHACLLKLPIPKQPP